MPSNLAGFSYIYNAVNFDIPFVESIKSVIDVVDEFVLTECYSQDATWEMCLQLKSKYPDKITLLRHPWVKHFTEIQDLANWTMGHIDQQIKYAMELQSDEVVHEKDLDKLVKVTEEMAICGKHAARWNYQHFLASPEVVFPFIYSSVIRIADRTSNWLITGDGVQFAIDKLYIVEDDVLSTDIEIFHYGKMKEPTKAWAKEWDFQNLFKDIGFPDPHMLEMKDKLGKEYCDYPFLFEETIKKGVISRFNGTHPAVMQERIKEFKDMGWEQFQSKVIEGLKLL
jgi:hypothetical protein